ncbi:MAG: aminopeptidase N [Parachlamydiaceae bacterium]
MVTFVKKIKNIGAVKLQKIKPSKITQSILFGCLLQASVLGQLFGFDVIGHQEIEQYLNQVAIAEAQEWNKVVDDLVVHFPLLMPDGSVCHTLNRLKLQILESQDLALIKLFNRAIRNHDSLSLEKAEPVPSYYKHYQPPPFYVPFIDLILDVQESAVLVTTHLKLERNSDDHSLILDGRDHDVHSVFLNGQKVLKEDYRITPHELILLNLPQDDSFTVTIHHTIHPFINDTLEGMYRCGQWLTTQCESEGARRIFFTLDRPDVLSRMTTTIIADPDRYPYRLSNGNLVEETMLGDGRASIIWDDPFAKPSYLFACVLGDFSRLSSDFITKSKNKVELEIYVEPGKESRAEYALFALQKAMEFDEELFDREYDLSSLKMVGIPDFNSGAMENKGLMIFNDIRLLVDSQSGTDKSFREVAHVVGHEYFHNWSGNRVTIRNWFEIALKEAFTDLRAMLFSEWLFGSEFIRPKAVLTLREHQFPEETSEKGHPIIVESYVDAHSIYDNTTYTKGREVFRALKNYIDVSIADGFREVQNLYFHHYDGQAVTFKELLAAGDAVLKKCGKELSLFERWFHQPGTPIVKVLMDYDPVKGEAAFSVEQSSPHPRTGEEQLPLQIPFSFELVGRDGKSLHPKHSMILEEKKTQFKVKVDQEPIPVFMHGYSAPVILKYDYAREELACIMKYVEDPFCRWEAGQNYSIEAFKEMKRRIDKDPFLKERGQSGESVFSDLFHPYLEALSSDALCPLAKGQLLEIPSLRAFSQAIHDFDFEGLSQLRQLFSNQMALFCKDVLKNLLQTYPVEGMYAPHPDQMQIRELRQAVLTLLSDIDEDIHQQIIHQYQTAQNFDDYVTAFCLSLKMKGPWSDFVIADFHKKWKHDKAIFNFWLSSQASLPNCTIEDLKRLQEAEGYDAKNPNHIRSIFRTFIANLKCYHDSTGMGYSHITNNILEIGKFNPQLAHNYIAVPAFLDFEYLPPNQQALMAKELERLRTGEAPAQTRELVERMLERYHQEKNDKSLFAN